MPDFRRGAAAIAKAQEKPSGGGFRPFTPSIFWQEDGDERYLLFLNPLEDIPTVDLIGFIPQSGKKANGDTYTRYESVIARTDPAIDESSDAMVDEWQGKPKKTNIAVAVELEPVLEKNERGRMRPVGLEVKMREYDRAVRNEDGEVVEGEYEEVESPVIGFVEKSPRNFYNVISAFDANKGPIEEIPLLISQVGKGTEVSFTVEGLESLEVDLGPLIDNLEFFSYLGHTDESEALLDEIVDLDDAAAVQAIGAFLLDKRLVELSDKERYDELFESITSTLDKFGNKSKGNKKKATTKRERPARRSQRRGASEEAPAETTEAEAPAEDTSEAPEPETKAKAKRAPRAKKEDAEAAPTNDRLARLREKAAERKKSE